MSHFFSLYIFLIFVIYINILFPFLEEHHMIVKLLRVIMWYILPQLTNEKEV